MSDMMEHDVKASKNLNAYVLTYCINVKRQF